MGSRVRISKHKNIFSKGYHPNCFDEIFLIKKVKNIVRWTYVIHRLNGEKVARISYKKVANYKPNRIQDSESNQEKWKGYDSSINILINMKDIRYKSELISS